jgi:hypothetical protein
MPCLPFLLHAQTLVLLAVGALLLVLHRQRLAEARESEEEGDEEEEIGKQGMSPSALAKISR